MKKQRYMMKLSYDGTRFHGWQIQPNAISVQGEIERCMGIILRSPISIVGCGRTDTGVHAQTFFAHFDLEAATDLSVSTFVFKLNQLLPAAIAIHNINACGENDHARFSAKSRTYRYFIHQKKNAFKDKHSYYYKNDLDLELIKAGGAALLKYKDFSSFAKSHGGTSHNLCNLMKIEVITDGGNELYFEITANRFLRNMVRALVGTLLELGSGKINLEQFINIIDSKNRSKAGASAPAKGLFLWDITY